MKKRELIQQFTSQLIVEKKRKNKVTNANITSSLITSAVNLAFVNESCQSSGKISKSQVIYRKINEHTKDEISKCFNNITIRFFKILKIISRNRKLIVSFDTTKEAFYGKPNKAKPEDRLYLHPGSIAKESYFYYEFMTSSITCNVKEKFILNGLIVPRGFYMEDYVYRMISFIKQLIPVELFLFDRGFGSWGMIYRLKELKVNYIVFWKKQGNWYKKYLSGLENKEMKLIKRTNKYNRNKTCYPVSSNFVIIKQYNSKNFIFDWIFATNLTSKLSSFYIKRYKKRWGIETTYRVIDKIRIYTTSTNPTIRYFLFMFTCFVHNIWKFFQMQIGTDLTLSNFKTNMIIFMTETGMIYPKHYDYFKNAASKLFNLKMVL